jgi:hypothetical protein
MPWDTSIVIRQFAKTFNMDVAAVEREMRRNLHHLLAVMGMNASSRKN